MHPCTIYPVAIMVFKVPRYLFSHLMDRLKQDSPPRALHLLGLLHNTMKGVVVSNFYTDSWPQFSALVGEIVMPKVSKINLESSICFLNTDSQYQY